jgi:dihydropyrimidinase
MLHHAVDYTPYEGRTLRAWPDVTLSRGEVVWRDGRPHGEPGRGRFLRCDLPAPAKPKGGRVHAPACGESTAGKSPATGRAR